MDRRPAPDPAAPPALASGDGAGEGPYEAAPSPAAPAMPPPAEGWADDRVRERLWWAAGAIWRRRWLLAALVVAATAAAVAASLAIPNRYSAETRVLLPESGAQIGGLLESVAPGASALLGGGSGEYTRYLAILQSRTMLETVVDRFGLADDPEAVEAEDPRLFAIRRLDARTTLEVSLDSDYLAVHVLDEDPGRAAQIANFYVAELNERNIELSTGSAAEHRRFLEGRLREAEAAMDTALSDLQAFQERSGVVQVEAQAEALMTSLAEAQGSVAQAEAQYRALAAQLGEENPDVASARAALESARGQVRRLTGGDEAFMPVPIGRLPAVSREYAVLMAEVKTQEEILRAIRPFYEQAVLTEREDADAVQVLDPAVPPSQKAEPRRSLIVVSVAVAAGLLGALLVLVGAWIGQRGPAVAARLRASA